MAPDARLGLVEFGSEAYHSSGNVTFAASGFAMELEGGKNKLNKNGKGLDAIGKGCKAPKVPGSDGVRVQAGSTVMIMVILGTMVLFGGGL